MTAEADTVREQVRRGRPKGSPSPETRALLARYQRSMRVELTMLLHEIRPYPRGGKPRPTLAEGAKLWELAIKLARELGSEIDVPAQSPNVVPMSPRGALGPVDFG